MNEVEGDGGILFEDGCKLGCEGIVSNVVQLFSKFAIDYVGRGPSTCSIDEQTGFMSHIAA